MKLTAFTQIIVTLAVTAWVFILPVEAVATILVQELALLLYIKHDKMTMAAIGGLAVFTGMMVLLQLLFGSPLDVSLIGGLRMLVMTMAFLCLLAASRIQDIAKALVDNPDEVVVTESEKEEEIVIELKVAPTDMGKVIGKQGRIAKAIRSVVKAASSKMDKKVIVEIQ